MAFQTASLLAVSLLILWVSPGKSEGKHGRGGGGGGVGGGKERDV